LSVTRPLDTSSALYYKRSIVTIRLSGTVTEIWRLKDSGVTRLTDARTDGRTHACTDTQVILYSVQCYA